MGSLDLSVDSWVTFLSVLIFTSASLPSGDLQALLHKTQSIDLWDYLPSQWSSVCQVDYFADVAVNATISCRLTPHDSVQWKLADLRNALQELVEYSGLKVAVNLHCETGGIISLPYPMRAPGLVKLTVSNCFMLDKYADFGTSAETLGDWMQVQDMRDCVWLNNPNDLIRVLSNAESISSDYDCGQDSTLETYIYRNISDRDLQEDPCLALLEGLLLSMNMTLSGDLNSILNASQEDFNDFTEAAKVMGHPMEVCIYFLKQLRDTVVKHLDDKEPRTTPDILQNVLDTRIQLNKIQTSCFFEHLQIQDESFSPMLDRKQFEYMTENAEYPELRILNYSHTGITEVPRELREWRLYFPKSMKLQLIDLSHCYITEIGNILPYPSLNGVETTLDLRYNRITKISWQMFNKLALVPDFMVDIRYNPIDCGCDLKDLLTELHNRTVWETLTLARYRQQLAQMTCATPTRLEGRVLATLAVDELQCVVVVTKVTTFWPVLGSLIVTIVILLVLVLFLAVRRHSSASVRLHDPLATKIKVISANEFDGVVCAAQDSKKPVT